MKGNFKVKALKTKEGLITKGNIYSFVDGRTIWDCGNISCAYESLEDFLDHNKGFKGAFAGAKSDNLVNIELDLDTAKILKGFIELTDEVDVKETLKRNGLDTGNMQVEKIDNRLYMIYNKLKEALKSYEFNINLHDMARAQQELDDKIFERAGLEEYPKGDIELALRVELGELAQEWKGFKYWKQSKGQADKSKMLEEWADCMHFALSLENNRTDEEKEHLDSVIADYYQKEIRKSFDTAFKWLRVWSVVWLGLDLGFTEQEMEEAYYNKNTINWQRMESDY